MGSLIDHTMDEKKKTAVGGEKRKQRTQQPRWYTLVVQKNPSHINYYELIRVVMFMMIISNIIYSIYNINNHQKNNLPLIL